MAKKILIADDDDNIRRLVKMTLMDEGLETHEACDGEEAIKKVWEIKPDLVVLDVMMPKKVGYEVCEEIKNNRETSHAYVIFMTARGTSVAEASGTSSGGDEFMVKPFEPAELRQKVKKALNME